MLDSQGELGNRGPQLWIKITVARKNYSVASRFALVRVCHRVKFFCCNCFFFFEKLCIFKITTTFQINYILLPPFFEKYRSLCCDIFKIAIFSKSGQYNVLVQHEAVNNGSYEAKTIIIFIHDYNYIQNLPLFDIE